jgi:aspartyl-tRNA(Asn)/glutamyl-tRNA(Gln) amidotransferase subunit A
VEELDSGALKAWKSVIDRFSELGCEVMPVSIPSLKYALSAYYVIATSEAASNLARYDGVRYDGK